MNMVLVLCLNGLGPVDWLSELYSLAQQAIDAQLASSCDPYLRFWRSYGMGLDGGHHRRI